MSRCFYVYIWIHLLYLYIDEPHIVRSPRAAEKSASPPVPLVRLRGRVAIPIGWLRRAASVARPQRSSVVRRRRELPRPPPGEENSDDKG